VWSHNGSNSAPLAIHEANTSWPMKGRMALHHIGARSPHNEGIQGLGGFPGREGPEPEGEEVNAQAVAHDARSEAQRPPDQKPSRRGAASSRALRAENRRRQSILDWAPRTSRSAGGSGHFAPPQSSTPDLPIGLRQRQRPCLNGPRQGRYKRPRCQPDRTSYPPSSFLTDSRASLPN